MKRRLVSLWQIAVLTLGIIASGTAIASASTAFYVENDSDTTVYHLYMSRHSSGIWGPDQLGSDVLRPGERLTLNVPDGAFDTCYWDVGVVFTDGTTDAADFDMCSGDTVHIY